MKSAWAKIIEAANRHNEPGKFTTLIGYEYTLARKIKSASQVFSRRQPSLPFSRIMSPNPKIMAWMDNLRIKGMDTIAVPHNSNGSTA